MDELNSSTNCRFIGSKRNKCQCDSGKLVNHIGIEIRIAHYPPYTSKYNPIEHRLFPHLS